MSFINIISQYFIFQAADFDFNYGIEYAWNLVLFNMVVSFSLTTPIIVPFGKENFIIDSFLW